MRRPFQRAQRALSLVISRRGEKGSRPGAQVSRRGQSGARSGRQTASRRAKRPPPGSGRLQFKAPASVSGGKLSGSAASMTRMNALTLLAGLCLGIVLGAAIGYLLAKGRLAAATADLTGQAPRAH